MNTLFGILNEVRTVIFGFNERLDRYMKTQTPVTFGHNDKFYQGLYISEYDKNYITFSDKKNGEGIVVTYNRSFIQSFAETKYDKKVEDQEDA